MKGLGGFEAVFAHVSRKDGEREGAKMREEQDEEMGEQRRSSARSEARPARDQPSLYGGHVEPFE